MTMRRRVAILLAMCALASCTTEVERPAAGPAADAASTATPPPAASTPPGAPASPAPVGTPTPDAPPGSEATAEPSWVEVRYRAEDRTGAPEDHAFAATLASVLTDARGWVRARYRFVEDPAGPYRIVLAEGAEVDELCRPLDTMSTYSCQNGPVVALNADRWRGATPQWPADLASYRAMLVNHEVGHLLHLHHPRPQCPGPGLPAPVMAQQSTELDGCLPNPWPLQWEVDLALQRAEPLAPPAEHDPSGHRPSPPPARS